ncbi:hypothetical protein WA026_010297 [Henosepilachna vigintioctopunctata]|uniref:Uncharacterized protein n=1 Tax=Henosepilachna vigintioctopunctata TaxID=420089 RepID=A0AAW1UI93_9CUCU
MEEVAWAGNGKPLHQQTEEEVVVGEKPGLLRIPNVCELQLEEALVVPLTVTASHSNSLTGHFDKLDLHNHPYNCTLINCKLFKLSMRMISQLAGVFVNFL